MARKESWTQNKNLGHLIALCFFVLVAYFFYAAASNMNYVWKWNSVPKYFAYNETITIEAPIDGKLLFENGKYYVDGDEKVELKKLDSSFSFDYQVNEKVYEGDYIASKEELKAGPVLNGLWTTLKISFFAALLTFFVGIIVAFMKLSSYQFLKDIATVYITIVRGTPLLVQIFLFYFIVANIFELDRFVAGVLSLGIFFGAYMAEILRGAIQSIDKGQLEAASSLGITKLQAMRYIILPQAFKRALPTLVGEMIALVKDSSLVSVISITDLTKVGKEIVANTFSPFETWIVVALLYLTITSTLSLIGHKIEKRMAAKGGMS
ncbi:amino acid ABC transporter permease [Halarcobacter anaerophilus]|jgi:polar amino acid transport system permease protein|uniref:Putative glutamine transport system permease protein GlnP n=1 Tax=Halarcobacter anaerophilus TaxID=877500 RepID=A0A4Q0XZD7_9BACT|nr:amino acid ABC transporter permease [Halarcobacter anaerophilus]QDF30007.1 amino acid ABC transporter, permease protein [Halarcobacter anaerophilus]RXJ63056.1 ABC transporter permease [Halarcobacter anaerophilus]